jgi:hypothetical protein
MNISTLMPSEHNPRIISQENLNKLKSSIKGFEKMMEARPLVVTEDMRVVGGNQRLKALIQLGYESIPDCWVKVMSFTAEEEREFIVKDNASYGGWDWDLLLEEFGQDELFDWSIEVPNLGDLEKVEKVNDLEDDEWVGMPDFETKDDPLQIVVKFENEGLRKEFAEKMNIEFTYAKEGNKSWTTWYPYKGKGDWKSKKYE